MMPEGARRDTGCMVIGETLSGEGGLSGLSSLLAKSGAATEIFCEVPGEALHPALQRGYQRVRLHCRQSAIAAAGGGCDAALALAGQLPVDRLALVTGSFGGEPPRGPRRRIRSYARRNAAFCVAEVLILQFGPAEGWLELEPLARALCNCRIHGVRLSEAAWTNGKEQMKNALCGFLCAGVLPKSLAERAEMCIIYE